MSRVFESCDTNIIFYSLNTDCKEFEKASTYMNEKYNSDNFAICELVLIELYILLRKETAISKPLGNKPAL